MSYRKALEILQAYKPGRLIDQEYECDGECCALGVLLHGTRLVRYSGEPIEDVLRRSKRTRAQLQFLEMSAEEAERLQDVNDGYLHDDWDHALCTEQEGRYRAVVAFLETQLAQENALQSEAAREVTP